MSTMEVLEHPMVKELMESTKDNFAESNNLLPHIEKDLVMISPGRWNERIYTEADIIEGYNNTDWSDRDNTAVFADHKDKSVKQWLGEFKNIRLSDHAVVLGDFHCADFDTATKLKFGKMKSGISPKVIGDDDGIYVKNFKFLNFSHVINPAVKTAYIFNSDDGVIIHTAGLNEKELAEITAFEHKRKQLGITLSQFYAIPRDPASQSRLPIFDAAHVRDASAKINQVKGVSSAEKATATIKIMAAAKKFGVTVGGNTMSEDKTKEEIKAEEEAKAKETAEAETKVKEAEAAKAAEANAKPEGDKTEGKEKPAEESPAEGEEDKTEVENFEAFAADYAKENPKASISELMEAFKSKGKEGTEKTMENIDLKGLSKSEAIEMLEKTLKDVKSGTIEMSGNEAVASLTRTVKTMAEEIKELKGENETPERLGHTVVELGQESNGKSSQGMINYLKTIGGY